MRLIALALIIILTFLYGGVAMAATIPEGTKGTRPFEAQPDGYTPLTGRVDEFTPITAKDLAASIRAGINIGNTLDATGSGGLHTETSWGNPKITPELFLAIKEKGLDVVRISTSWEPHMDGDCNIDPMFMDRVQTVVEDALAAGLYVILNTHHEDDYLLPRISNADYDGAFARLSRMWEQIAERFKGYNERLIFNIFNEPRAFRQPSEWNGGTPETRDVIQRLNLAILSQIRQSGGHNAQRVVMLTPIQASVWYAEHLKPPADDAYIMVSIHAYEPYQFALNTQGTAIYPANSNIKDVFSRIDAVFLRKGIPAIMDETGAMNKNGNLAERVKWAAEFAAWARKKGVPVLLWDNGITDIRNGESFGLIDRETCEWIFPELVEPFLVK